MYLEYQKKFFKYFVDDKKGFYKYFALSFVVGVLELLGVALTYPFITRVLSSSGMDKRTVLFGIFIVLAFLIKNIIMIYYYALQADFTKTCEMEINKKFMNYFLGGDYNIVSKVPFTSKMKIMHFLTPNSVNNFLIRILNFNVNIFIFVLITAFLFYKFFTATVITLICSAVILYAQSIFFKFKTGVISGRMNKAIEDLNQVCNEPLLNIKSIKIFKSEKFFYEKYSEQSENVRKTVGALTFYNSIPPYVTEPFIIILLLILLAIISIENLHNPSVLVASYAVIVSAIFRLAPAISRIQVNLTGINTSLPQVKELITYYEQFGLDRFVPAQRNCIVFNDSIELKDVSFSYGEKDVLKNINLKIKKGEFIGIAGSSGAGKTTLIDIIAGLLNIKTGEIFVDESFIPGIKMPELKIGYIPQDYSVISASIRENVAFGETQIDDERVIEALKSAQLYDFVQENFAEGIYANPFVDTTGLSQGQKQRLAIARALYMNPDIIILDEATSSLDLKTEDEICGVLNKLKGEKTIIAVAHRLSTIKNADRIIFMKDSTIKDSASFDELFQNNSEFRDLVLLNNANSVH